MDIGDKIKNFFKAGDIVAEPVGRLSRQVRILPTIARAVATGGLVVSLAACTTTSGAGPKQTWGGLIGAGLGGWLGAEIGGHGTKQLITTGLGTLIGLKVGSEIGASLDRADRMYAEQAMQQAHAAPVGRTITWHNPRSGNRGSFRPVRTGETTDGLLCREYETTVTIGGRTERAKGVACRDRDGQWRIAQADADDVMFAWDDAPSAPRFG